MSLLKVQLIIIETDFDFSGSYKQDVNSFSSPFFFVFFFCLVYKNPLDVALAEFQRFGPCSLVFLFWN